MSRTGLRLVKSGERELTRSERASAELQLIRQGLDRLESMWQEIMQEKRRRLDQMETLILASDDEAPQAA